MSLSDPQAHVRAPSRNPSSPVRWKACAMRSRAWRRRTGSGRCSRSSPWRRRRWRDGGSIIRPAIICNTARAPMSRCQLRRSARTRRQLRHPPPRHRNAQRPDRSAGLGHPSEEAAGRHASARESLCEQHRRRQKLPRLSRSRARLLAMDAADRRRNVRDRRDLALQTPRPQGPNLRLRDHRRHDHRAAHRSMGPHAPSPRRRLSADPARRAGGGLCAWPRTRSGARRHDHRRTHLLSAQQAPRPCLRPIAGGADHPDRQHRAQAFAASARLLYGRQSHRCGVHGAKRLDRRSDQGVADLLERAVRRQFARAASRHLGAGRHEICAAEGHRAEGCVRRISGAHRLLLFLDQPAAFRKPSQSRHRRDRESARRGRGLGPRARLVQAAVRSSCCSVIWVSPISNSSGSTTARWIPPPPTRSTWPT